MGNSSTSPKRAPPTNPVQDAKSPDDSPHMAAAQASLLADGVVFRRRGAMLRAEYKDYALYVAGHGMRTPRTGDWGTQASGKGREVMSLMALSLATLRRVADSCPESGWSLHQGGSREGSCRVRAWCAGAASPVRRLTHVSRGMRTTSSAYRQVHHRHGLRMRPRGAHSARQADGRGPAHSQA